MGLRAAALHRDGRLKLRHARSCAPHEIGVQKTLCIDLHYYQLSLDRPKIIERSLSCNDLDLNCIILSMQGPDMILNCAKDLAGLVS